VIFGPSAGWTLSDRFLNRFDDIVLIEPDPLARLALATRLARRANVTLIARDDLLPWSEREPQSFETFLELYSSHAILFSNVLGQLALTDHTRARAKANAEELEDDRHDSTERFHQALKGREWASYHDLFSAERAPLLTPELENLETAPDAATLARLAYPDGAELTDHEMLWLSQGRATRLASWHLRPGRYHLIGFVHARDNQRG
jgi:hypothetical protein